ncbi:hypothetical protein FRB96_001944 [Tulasnella sp. 330]|nr:hypothetical protein FRB96_001944 [Tulasnella sp. 330]
MESTLGREIYAIAYHHVHTNHWSIWVPLPNHQGLGKIIHVAGGMDMIPFRHEFKRVYNKDVTTTKMTVLLLGRTHKDFIIFDDFAEGAEKPKSYKSTGTWIDLTARDAMEELALMVPAPPSKDDQKAAILAKLKAQLEEGHQKIDKKTEAELEKDSQKVETMPLMNCQDWLRDYVEHLVAADILPKGAIQLLDQLPTKIAQVK